MNAQGLTLVAGMVVAGLMALSAACAPEDGCASGTCMPKSNAAAPAKAEAGEVAMVAREKPEVNTAVLSTLIRSGAPLAIFDARTGKYDDGRRIPGAKGLSPEASAEEVAKMISSKEMLVVTYCANLKCPASAMLAAHLRKLGYKNVIEYPYGIEGWAAADMKVEKAR